MKKKPIILLVFAFVFCLSIATAQAANIISLTPTAQTVGLNDPVTLELWMDFTDTTVGGGFDLFFDSSVLSFVSYMDSGLGDAIFQRDPDELSGELNGIAFGDFGGLTGNNLIGTLAFTALDFTAPGVPSLLTMSENTDLIPGGFNQLVSFQGAEVNVVPIPGTLLLLGGGLVGLVGIGRKKRS